MGKQCRSREHRYMDKFPLTTKRLVLGHASVCQGCCCGNTANGRPAVPVEWLKKEWRARGLLKRIQLTISGCLGPCDVPNVVTISNESGTQWLGGVTEFSQYRALLEWAITSGIWAGYDAGVSGCNASRVGRAIPSQHICQRAGNRTESRVGRKVREEGRVAQHDARRTACRKQIVPSD
jgi:hypothetical protein